MRRLAVLLLLLAACGGDDAATTTTTAGVTSTTAAATTTAPTTPSTGAPSTTAASSGAELGLFSVSFSGVMVVIFNGTAETADITGYWLCQGEDCAEIPAVQLAPGAYLALDAGAPIFFPIPGSVTVEGVLDVGELNPVSGEMALYGSADFGDSAAIVSYVEWGTSGHTHSATATAAGIWQDGWVVETTADTGALTYFPDVSTSDESGWSAF